MAAIEGASPDRRGGGAANHDAAGVCLKMRRLDRRGLRANKLDANLKKALPAKSRAP
jgi:hypothetical protein